MTPHAVSIDIPEASFLPVNYIARNDFGTKSEFLLEF